MTNIEYKTENGRSLTKCKHYDILVGTAKCLTCEHRDLNDGNRTKIVYCNKGEVK